MGSSPAPASGAWGTLPLSSSACSWFSSLFPGWNSVLSRAHRGEGVWAPSSTGSFFNVLAYAEAELGLGLGSSRPVGIQGGNGQGALFIRHMLGICSGLVLHGELGGQWCRHFHGRGRGLSWMLLESLTARGVCPAGLLACLSSLSYPPCREGLTQSQLCCRL